MSARMVEKVTSVEYLNRLRERARRLEQEAAELRAELDRVVETLSRPVATYEVDGEVITITEADVEAVRARLIKPRSEETLRQVALIYKLAERLEKVPEEEVRRKIAADIEAIREEAIAKGVAIDDPAEVLVND